VITLHIAHVERMHVQSVSDPQLEAKLTSLTEQGAKVLAALEANNAVLTATNERLKEVAADKDYLLETVADLTDKLAAALAAGADIPPEIMEAIGRQKTVADAILSKTTEIAASVDIPTAP